MAGEKIFAVDAGGRWKPNKYWGKLELAVRFKIGGTFENTQWRKGKKKVTAHLRAWVHSASEMSVLLVFSE